MTAALIAAKLNDGHTGSDVHNLCYRMILNGQLERHHNGRGWEYVATTKPERRKRK